MADDKDLKAGDRVEWNTSQGKTTGKVKRRVTEPIRIKRFKVKASKDDPQYVVESDKSGNEAAHKPGALKKKG